MIEEAFPTQFNCHALMDEMLASIKKDKETYVAYCYKKLAPLNRLELKGENSMKKQDTLFRKLVSSEKRIIRSNVYSHIPNSVRPHKQF